MLTVVIPTYGRPEDIKNLVDTLLPQRNERWTLLIVDNCSPVPIRDLVPADVEVVRNVVNIGASGNFPRCFEMAKTDWVWMIGDDDLVDPGGVERVLRAISEHPDAAVINFGARGHTDGRDRPQIFHGFDEFLRGCDSISYSIWMSGNIYARKHYWPYLHMAYWFANTHCGHYVLLLFALMAGGTFVQLPATACRQSAESWDNTGDSGELIAGVSALAELPMTKQQRGLFCYRLREKFVNLPVDAIMCSYQWLDTDDRDELLYLFANRWTRFALAQGSLLFSGYVMCFRLLLGCAAGRSLLRNTARIRTQLTGKPFHLRRAVSRFHRA